MMGSSLFSALFFFLEVTRIVNGFSPPISKLKINPEDMETAINILPQLAPFIGVAQNCRIILESVFDARSNVSNGIVKTILDLKISSECAPESKICTDIHVLKPKNCENCEKIVDVSNIQCIPDLIVEPEFIFGGFVEMEDPSSNTIINKISQEAIKFLYGHFNTSTPCPLRVKKIIRAKQQSVMGFNYELELQVETNSFDFNCKYALKNCNNIHVHEPIAEHCPHGEQSCIIPIDLQDVNCVDINFKFHQGPLLGGYRERNIDDEIEEVARGVTNQLEASFGMTDSCHIKVENILSAKSQVVAGTNFLMDIELSSSGPGCDFEVKVCRNVKIFRPLSFNCLGQPCLSLSETENIQCTPSVISNNFKRHLGEETANFLYHLFNTNNACQLDVKDANVQRKSYSDYEIELQLETREGQVGCEVEKKSCKNIHVQKLDDPAKCPYNNQPCIIPYNLEQVVCNNV